MIKDDAPTPDGLPDLRRHLLTQRGRILDGMAEAVARHGYAATAVADVLDECGVSRRTFYRHFPNKEECFLATFDFAVQHVSDAVVLAFLTSGSRWEDRVRRGFELFMGFVMAEPAFARLCLVEVLAAGPRALERRNAALRRFTSFVVQAAADAPSPYVIPATVPEAIVGGVQSVIASRLLNGRASELPELVDDLVAWGMLPFLGRDERPQLNTHVS